MRLLSPFVEWQPLPGTPGAILSNPQPVPIHFAQAFTKNGKVAEDLEVAVWTRKHGFAVKLVADNGLWARFDYSHGLIRRSAVVDRLTAILRNLG